MRHRFRRRPKLRAFSIPRLLPNLVTLSSLCVGLTGLRFGLNGDYRNAVIAVMVAAVLDSLDGRLARRLNATSRFGAELDSLSDFVCFGVVPSLLMYLAIMSPAGAIGWVIALMFPICSALRLARFNTALFADAPQPAWAGSFFTGVPAPAGALLVMVPLMASFEIDLSVLRHPIIGGVFLVGVGALMVSRLPTFSLKKGRIPPQWVLPVMVMGTLVVAMLASSPWATMPLIGLLYLLSLPFAWRARRRLEATYGKSAGDPSAATDPMRLSPSGSAAVVPLRSAGEDRT
jgi:CDP-diacylglycerol--serine O-phosphatidyltransferase